jgi:hypothetical protein
MYAKSRVASVDDCFEKCEADVRCAAASFTPSDCYLHKFGFVHKVLDSGAWTAFVKLAVSEDADKLSERFPTAKQNTRYTSGSGSGSTGLNVLTPSLCFKQCAERDECAAASFTTNIYSDRNCYMFAENEFVKSDDPEEIDTWVSYSKPRMSDSTVPTITTKSSTTFYSKSSSSIIVSMH